MFTHLKLFEAIFCPVYGVLSLCYVRCVALQQAQQVLPLLSFFAIALYNRCKLLIYSTIVEIICFI